MSQANTKNTANRMSRRSAIALVGASSIATAAVMQATPATTAVNPDAELLALGPELESVFNELVSELEVEARQRREFNEICENAGLPRVDIAEWLESGRSRDDYKQYEKQREVLRPEPLKPPQDADDENDRLTDRAWDIRGRIFAFRPRTIEGFRLLVLADSMFKLDWSSFHDEVDRDFFEAVCAFVGVVPLYEQISFGH